MSSKTNGKKNFKKGRKPTPTRETSTHDDYRKDNAPKTDKVCDMDKIKGNDIAWWNKSPLYPLSASVQYNKIPGYVYDHSSYLPSAPHGNLSIKPFLNGVYTDGGVLNIEYYPTLGVSLDANSPVNQCFNSLFARLVQNTNSANVGFQQMDVALLTLGTLSIVNLIAEAKRAIGLTNMYSRENGFYPEAILHSLGYSPQIMQQNRPKYVSRLQTLIMNFNALGIPSYIDLFKRGVQLGRNVYMDEDQMMAFPFFFTSKGYYVYNDVDSRLDYKNKDDAHSFDQLLYYIEEALEAMRNTSDLGNIMGALRRAFPDAERLRLDLVDYEEKTIPSFDRNVNWQLNNLMTPAGTVDNLSVYQEPESNILLCNPTIALSADVQLDQTPNSFIINSYDGTVGEEFVMESTRMMYTSYQDPREGDYVISSCGTEIPASFKLTVRQLDGLYSVKLKSYNLVEADSMSDLFLGLTHLSNFKCRPALRFVIHNPGPNDYTVTDPTMDYNLYTGINAEQLEQLHLTALQSVYQLTV